MVTKLLFDFPWYRVRMGYEFVPEGPPSKGKGRTLVESFPSSARIRPLGGQLDLYRPFETYDVLYGQFAKVQTADDLLAFIKRYGPLTEEGFSDRGEDVDMAVDRAETLRRLLKVVGNDEATVAKLRGAGIAKVQLSPLNVEIVPDEETGRLRLRMKPKSLLEGMWIQFANAVSGGALLKECRQCGEWFQAGPGTGRKANAEFCKAEHKTNYFSLQRSR